MSKFLEVDLILISHNSECKIAYVQSSVLFLLGPEFTETLSDLFGSQGM
jgi:hypothetical protein